MNEHDRAINPGSFTMYSLFLHTAAYLLSKVLNSQQIPYLGKKGSWEYVNRRIGKSST